MTESEHSMNLESELNLAMNPNVSERERQRVWAVARKHVQAWQALARYRDEMLVAYLISNGAKADRAIDAIAKAKIKLRKLGYKDTELALGREDERS